MASAEITWKPLGLGIILVLHEFQGLPFASLASLAARTFFLELLTTDLSDQQECVRGICFPDTLLPQSNCTKRV